MKPISIQVKRGSSLESEHLVDAVLMDTSGNVVKSWGDSERPLFTRSSIKFLQAIALVESGALTGLQIPTEWLALACASHRAENFHVSAVLSWLDRLGLSETHLACGPQEPTDDVARIQLYKSGGRPGRRHNNCSGKHSGLLATAVFSKLPVDGYEKYDHPLQIRLRQILSEMSGLDHSQLPWGIDGCSLPNYCLPLSGLARSLAQMLPDAKVHTERAESSRQILSAVKQFPQMISGTHGFCTQLIQVTKGRVLTKIGAEGVETALIPELGLALALKVRDGAPRAAKQALLSVLRQQPEIQGLLTEATSEVSALEALIPTKIQNWMGQPVGRSEALLS